MKTTSIKILTLSIVMISFSQLPGQSLPSGLNLKNIAGGTFTMGSTSLTGNKEQQDAAPEHSVNLSPYSLSEAEITNAQYVEFLNAAYADGLISIVQGTTGPDNGLRLIQGTNLSSYEGKDLYTLDGTRVMKDHDNEDLDNNEFTGGIEPENPLNISYINFDDVSKQFYVMDPFDPSEFDWKSICDYQDWGTTKGSATGPVLNDFEDWAGAGNNHSNELQGWSLENPAAATNLPSKSEVANWPVTFIRWWGAKAFADYYGLTLPTEAQWEFAAKGGADFQYAVHDGQDLADANWNTSGLGTVAYHHVREAISGTANPFGLYNLAGNAWEWIQDNYAAPYSLSAVIDPLYEDGSTSRCWRGGSWNYHEATLQAAFRYKDDENRGNDHFGFRVAGPSQSLGTDKHSFNFEVYPNPSNGFISITSSSEKTHALKIFDTVGNLLFQTTFNNKVNITTTSWKSGVYIVQIDEMTKKLIKT